MVRHLILLMSALSVTMQMHGQEWVDNHVQTEMNIVKGLEYNLEMQSSVSKGETPLWLNSNKYGLSSLDKTNGYMRVAVSRPLHTDSARRWGIGYTADIVVPYHYTSHFVVQQAYAEIRWLHGLLTVGSKQYAPEMKNASLSSGAQTLGINARPVPQIRLALPEYWAIPGFHGWFHMKGHIAYGRMTDDNWQKDFTSKASKYTEDGLYHSKAGYLKIGNENSVFPISLEMGLEMACLFGGTSYNVENNGSMIAHGGTGFRSYWNAFVPGGQDVTDGDIYANMEGDDLGSWLLRLNYDAPLFKVGIYADKFFEDHSGMFLLDYDGYGYGDEYREWKRKKFFVYDLKDIMLGAEVNFKYTNIVRNIVFEYLYTKYQSGPVYHDHTYSVADHVAGQDNYYNHNIYPGWQHWGQVMGNPLYLSPIYNDNGSIRIMNNRFIAFHLGVDGCPFKDFTYRVLATYEQGFGTYEMPYLSPKNSVSLLLECGYSFVHDWHVMCGLGADSGSILGNNYGIQLTISKKGLLGK